MSVGKIRAITSVEVIIRAVGDKPYRIKFFKPTLDYSLSYENEPIYSGGALEPVEILYTGSANLKMNLNGIMFQPSRAKKKKSRKAGR